MNKTITTLLLLAVFTLGFAGCRAYNGIELTDQQRKDLEKENKAFLEDSGLAAEQDEEIVYSRELMEEYHRKINEQYNYNQDNRVRLLDVEQ